MSISIAFALTQYFTSFIMLWGRFCWLTGVRLWNYFYTVALQMWK